MTLSRSKPLSANTDHDWGEPDDRGFRHCEKRGCTGRWYWVASPNDPPRYACSGGLKRSELDRGGGPAPVSDRRREKRPDLRTPLQTYVERLPCLLAGHPEHACRGEVVAHHVVHKNHAGDWLERGGERVGNVVPLCAIGGHQDGPESVHVLGRGTFEARFGVDLAAAAERIGERYETSQQTQEAR